MTLQEVVASYAAWYVVKGVTVNDVVAIYTTEGISAFIHFLALNSIGGIPALINGRMPPSIAARYIKNIRAIGVITDEIHRSALVDGGPIEGARFVVAETDRQPVAMMPTNYPVIRKSGDIVMICHSSGTIGLPKAVMFGHKQFFLGKRGRLVRFPASDRDRMLSALPHSHSAGISYLMTATLLGLPTRVISNTSRENLEEEIRTFQPTTVVSFPEVYSALTKFPLPYGHFRSVRRWINTGDTAHEKHIRNLLTSAPGSRFVDGFGASELGMALFRRVSDKRTTTYGRCIGKPVGFAKAAIIDETGRRLPENTVGLLALRSRTITPGYWNSTDLTLKSRLDGYWLTGDLVYRDVNGQYFHVDRKVDAITTKAGPVYTLLLEEAIMKFPGVYECTVVGIPADGGYEKPVAVITPDPESTSSANEILTLLNRDHALRKLTREQGLACVVVLQGEGARLPTGPTGKVLKRVVREWLAENALAHENRLGFVNVDIAWFGEQKLVTITCPRPMKTVCTSNVLGS